MPWGLSLVLLLAAAAPASVEVLAGRVEVARVGLTSADVVVRLVVANRGPSPVTLRDLAYQVTLDGVPFRSGRLPGPISVPARSAVEVPIRSEVGYAEAGGTAWALLSRGETAFRVVGSVRVEGPGGSRTLPFEEAGRVGIAGPR